MNSINKFVKTINELGDAKDKAVKRGDYGRAVVIRNQLDEVKIAKRQLLAKEQELEDLKAVACDGIKAAVTALGIPAHMIPSLGECQSIDRTPERLRSLLKDKMSDYSKNKRLGDKEMAICKQCDRAGGITDMSTNPSGNKPDELCWSCWKSHQIDKLRGEVQALEAWQNVAAESNRDVSAYLQEKFPSLELDGGWPVSNIRKAIEHLETSELSGSEALYGFCGWLTTRDEAVTFSGHHNAGVAADLVALFCEVNDLAEPCDHWDKNLVHPKECRPDESKIIMEKVSEEDRPRLEDQFPSSWRSHLERILSKLSGDLSQDNVAAAKEILKNLLE